MYYEENNDNDFDMRKVFYYDNYNEAVVCEYLRGEIVRMIGRYKNGDFWFIKTYTKIGSDSRKYFNAYPPSSLIKKIRERVFRKIN